MQRRIAACIGRLLVCFTADDSTGASSSTFLAPAWAGFDPAQPDASVRSYGHGKLVSSLTVCGGVLESCLVYTCERPVWVSVTSSRHAALVNPPSQTQ